MKRERDHSSAIDRRRLITIAAAAAGAAVFPRSVAAFAPNTVTWRGIALGAPAMLTLQHRDEIHARHAVGACLAEIARLEKIFSLHWLDSALVRLNNDGRLDGAPADLRVLLAEALLLAARTEGAFDPTIQPLWQFQARHAGREMGSVDAECLAKARDLVGWRHVHIDGTTIRFAKRGMALTLNGIAQGYITDKVGDILRSRGFDHVLVDMGEQLAIGPKWDGTAWRVGLRDPANHDRLMDTLEVTSGAVATSSNFAGSSASGQRFAHILDPQTGYPADRWASVTVTTTRATLADGLSTALTLLPLDRWPALMGTEARAYAKAPGTQKGFWV